MPLGARELDICQILPEWVEGNQGMRFGVAVDAKGVI